MADLSAFNAAVDAVNTATVNVNNSADAVIAKLSAIPPSDQPAIDAATASMQSAAAAVQTVADKLASA